MADANLDRMSEAVFGGLGGDTKAIIDSKYFNKRQVDPDTIWGRALSRRCSCDRVEQHLPARSCPEFREEGMVLWPKRFRREIDA